MYLELATPSSRREGRRVMLRRGSELTLRLPYGETYEDLCISHAFLNPKVPLFPANTSITIHGPPRRGPLGALAAAALSLVRSRERCADTNSEKVSNVRTAGRVRVPRLELSRNRGPPRGVGGGGSLLSLLKV